MLYVGVNLSTIGLLYVGLSLPGMEGFSVPALLDAWHLRELADRHLFDVAKLNPKFGNLVRCACAACRRSAHMCSPPAQFMAYLVRRAGGIRAPFGSHTAHRRS